MSSLRGGRKKGKGREEGEGEIPLPFSLPPPPPHPHFDEGFLRYEFGGLILGGAYFRNFTEIGRASCRERV